MSLCVRLEAWKGRAVPADQQPCRVHGYANVPNGQGEVNQVRVVRRVGGLVVELDLEGKVVGPTGEEGRGTGAGWVGHERP